MKEYLKVIVLLVFFISSLNAENKKLKIAIGEDLIPYSFIDNNNKARGLLVDYWNLWSKKTGIEIEFIPSTFSKTLQNIKEKNVSIHASMFKNKSREEYANFLNKTFKLKANLHIKKENKYKYKYKNISDLYDKKVGVIKHTYFHRYLKENYPKIKLEIYSNYTTLLSALNKNEVKAILGGAYSTWYHLAKNIQLSNISKIDNFELNLWFYVGIIKGDKNLEEIVKKGMSKITKSDLLNIDYKWNPHNKLKNLQDENYKGKKDILSLNERSYLKNKDVNFAVSLGWEKYSTIGKDGLVEGFHIDLIRLINKNLNTSFSYTTYDTWKEAFENTKNSKDDAILGLSWSKQRENYFNFSPAYKSSAYSIIVRKDTKNINKLSDFNNKIFTTQEQNITIKLIKKEAPLSKIVTSKTIQDSFLKIKNKKADGIIILNAKNYDLKKYGLKQAGTFFNKSAELHIGINKEKVILTDILNKAIKSISEQQIKRLENKWFNKNSIFTKEELAYIEKSKSVKTGVLKWGQVLLLNNKNEISGLVGDILKKIEDISGLKFKAEEDTWPNLIKKIKNKKIDIIPTTFYTKERENYGHFTQDFLKVKEYIYVRKSNNDIYSLKDLSNKKVAVIKDFSSIKLLKKNVKNINIIETNTLEESILKLINGEVDALFETQISVEDKLKELLITSLKTVSQSTLKANKVRIFSKKNDLLLHSILVKSLSSIPILEKNKIISKWINTSETKNDLTIAIALGKEPFTFNNKSFKGIEFELIKKIFDISNINIKETKYLNPSDIQTRQNTHNNIDIFSSVKEENDDYYYSNDFISYENVVISRVKDNLSIDKIKDLKDKSIIAFSNAYNQMGEEYFKLFNKKSRTNLYKELDSQELQVGKFLNKEVDLIILDKNIFTWYLKKLSKKEINDFKFDYIFKGKNSVKVAFKDRRIRDTFNKNLKIIKNNGKYEDVFYKYLKSDIEAKAKVALLFSSLVSKSLFDNNIEELRNITNIFFDLPFIAKIEIYNKNNKREILYSNNEINLRKFYEQDVFYIPYGTPQKIGFLRIYFNEEELKEHSLSLNLIPEIKLFKTLDTYIHIKNTYRNLNYIDNKISFSLEEREFIKEHSDITYSTLNWEPISILDNNKLIGLMPDYLKLIEDKTGLNFIYKELATWEKINSEFKSKNIDLLPKVDILKSMNIQALESNEITNFRFAIVTKEDGSFADKISDLSDKILALPKGFPNYNFIKKHYPHIKIKEAKSMKEALHFVSNGEAYAFVAFSEVSIYNIKKYFPNLKIAGITNDKFVHNFLIQKDYPELLSIINKVLENITYKQKQEIRDKWIDEKVNTAVDTTLIYQLLAIFILILLIILYFMNKFKKAKEEMEEEKKKFEALFADSADAIVLAKDGLYFDVNNATLKLFKYKSKEELLRLKPGTLAPKYQENGRLSSELMYEHFQKCYKEGTTRCQWQSTKSTGEVFWVEFVFTRLKYNNENILHMLCRDINDKKQLEKEVSQRSLDLELSNEELEDSNEELQSTIQNLKQTQDKLIESEKMASLGGLVAGVAHEINTPVGIGLTGITHFEEMTSDILSKYKKEEMSQEDFEEYLETSKELSFLIHKNLEKAADLVRSFKQVAVDQSSEEKRVFNAKRYLYEILASIHSVTKKTNIKINITCDEKLSINSYPGAFSQVITNLIMNSIIHGFKNNEEGNINILISKEDKDIKISYKDDGCGIKKENLGKIFDPFFTTNRANGGSGLGLNIIYTIIKSQLKGEISCQSSLNNGVLFIIVFRE